MVAIAFAVCCAAVASAAADQYRWPLELRPEITSVLFDKRNGHPHGGLDISLFGQVGSIPVIAVADGRLLRMRVSDYGYGLALYILHDDGRVSVYAHLDSFAPRFAAIMDERRRDTGRWNLDTWFEEWEKPIRVRAGERIAFGGSTGTRTPHLHFEIRSDDSAPLNPLLNGFAQPDGLAPVITAVALVPADIESSVNGSPKPWILDDGEPPVSRGRVGVAVEAFDMLHARGRRLAPYRFELRVDDRLVFETRFDGFSYEEPRVHETIVDLIGRRRFFRVYNPYPASLPHFSGVDAGMLGDLAPGPHRVRVTVFDAAGHGTDAAFDVRVEPSANPAFRPWLAGDDARVLGNDDEVRSADGRFAVAAGPLSLFEPTRVAIRGEEAIEPGGPPCFRVDMDNLNRRRALAARFEMAGVDEHPRAWSVVSGRPGASEPLPTRYDPARRSLEGAIEGSGLYCAVRDREPPRWTTEVRKAARRKPAALVLRFSDDACGVDFDDIAVFADGKRLLLDLSPTRGTGVIVAENGLEPGERPLRVEMTDLCGHRAVSESPIAFP